MAKGYRNGRRGEDDELKSLKQENSRLRRELSKMRRVLDRVNYVSKSRPEEEHTEKFSEEKVTEFLKTKWACYDCGKGFLKIFTFGKPDGTYYYRKCEICDKRTKSQIFSEKVQGIFKKDEE